MAASDVPHALLPLGDDIRAEPVVDERRAGLQRRLDVDHCGTRVVVHADGLERVVGAVCIVRDDRRHRFAHEAHHGRASGLIPHGRGSAGCGA